MSERDDVIAEAVAAAAWFRKHDGRNHRKSPHGGSCAVCHLLWPCPLETVLRGIEAISAPSPVTGGGPKDG